MDIDKHDLKTDFKEFMLERTLNIHNNPYYCSEDEEDDDDMSQAELAKQTLITISAYQRGFVDAILLFCK